MKRRTYLLGLGTVAVGSGSVMGLGAFRSLTAERTAAIETTADADAFLAVERDTNVRPTAIGDDPLFSKSDGQLVFHFDGTGGDAAGAISNCFRSPTTEPTTFPYRSRFEIVMEPTETTMLGFRRTLTGSVIVVRWVTMMATGTSASALASSSISLLVTRRYTTRSKRFESPPRRSPDTRRETAFAGGRLAGLLSLFSVVILRPKNSTRLSLSECRPRLS